MAQWDQIVESAVACISINVMNTDMTNAATNNAAFIPNAVTTIAVVTLVLEIYATLPLVVGSAKLRAAATHTRMLDRARFNPVFI